MAAPPWSLAPNPAITDLASGYVWHVYPDAARIDLSGKTLTGLIVAVQAKLESKTGADISGEVGKYLAIMGLDFWQSADNPFELPHGASNQDSFIGSANAIDTSYRWFYGTISTIDDLKAKRPPDGLEQLTQVDPQTLDPDIVEPNEGSTYSITQGFELVESGYEGSLSYVDLRMTTETRGLFWPTFAAMNAVKGNVVSVACYASVQSGGGVSYAEIHATEIDAGGGYLGNASAEKTIGSEALADNLQSADLALTNAAAAKTNGEWYIEGAIGTVIRFHFVRPALVA